MITLSCPHPSSNVPVDSPEYFVGRGMLLTKPFLKLTSRLPQMWGKRKVDALSRIKAFKAIYLWWCIPQVTWITWLLFFVLFWWEGMIWKIWRHGSFWHIGCMEESFPPGWQQIFSLGTKFVLYVIPYVPTCWVHLKSTFDSDISQCFFIIFFVGMSQLMMLRGHSWSWAQGFFTPQKTREPYKVWLWVGCEQGKCPTTILSMLL